MAADEIVVRACREADVAVLAAMMRDIWYDSAGYRKVEEWYGVAVGGRHWWEHKADTLRNIFREHPDRVLVAEVDGEVTGYATLIVEPGGIGCVGENGVHPKYRRRGIGKRLHEAVLRRLKDAGVSLVFVTTTLENTPARRVYESHGFQTIHTNVLMVNRFDT